jgi:DNA polymerase-1
MIDLDHALDEAGSDARMLLTVHDELVLEVPEGERDATDVLVREVMEHVTTLRVPLTVDIGFGPNWAAAK